VYVCVMVPISYLGGTHPVVFSTWASRTATGLAGESRDFFLGLAGEKGFYFLGFVLLKNRLSMWRSALILVVLSNCIHRLGDVHRYIASRY
jgi:hypothetical protein